MYMYSYVHLSKQIKLNLYAKRVTAISVEHVG